MNVVLWILQILLALLFLFAGGTKLIMSAEALSQPTTPNQVMLPVWFIRFIGVCEFLGGLGLLLPGLLKTRQYLTPLAALGLAVIMIGAVVFTVINGAISVALVNVVILLLLLFIAYARWRVVPHGGRR
jgi:hypothetical protein